MFFGSVKKNIIVLAISNSIIGLIEFIFNIYLSRIFGAQGLGLLSLISPVNCIFLSFMTEGVVVTMSKISSRLNHEKAYSFMNINVRISTILSFSWSLFLALLVWLLAPYISKYFLGDSALTCPILSVIPLMLLMSISNILKGYFLGLDKIKIPAIINISEKLLRFPLLYFLIYFLLNSTSFPPITLIYFCYALGEIQSVILLKVYYQFIKPKGKDLPLSKDLLTKVASSLSKGALPICLTQCVFEFANAFSSIIVKSRLSSIGFSNYEALALLGKYRGMVFPLLVYPMILVGAACAIVVPKISTLIASNKIQAGRRLIKRTLILALGIGLITMIVFLLFSNVMGEFFYKRSDLSIMIKLAGLIAPLFYLGTTTSSLLISLGAENLSFRNSLLQQLILLIGLIVFTGVPILNIYGYFLAIAISQGILLKKNLFFLHLHNFI